MDTYDEIETIKEIYEQLSTETSTPTSELVFIELTLRGVDINSSLVADTIDSLEA